MNLTCLEAPGDYYASTIAISSETDSLPQNFQTPYDLPNSATEYHWKLTRENRQGLISPNDLKAIEVSNTP